MALRCTVTTPDRLVHDGAAKLVVVPALDGELGILPRHAPLLALLGVGELRIHGEGGTRESIFVDGGFVQVIRDSVNVLATDAARAAEIDPAAAEEALAAARARGAPGLSIAAREECVRRRRAAAVRARIATGKSAPE
jgi:F-type H+-transporting ATPase subunit epsilon